MPAAPPPTIKMSDASLLTRDNLHSVFGEKGAASLMFHSVYGHAAFEANSHSAKRAARFSAYGKAKMSDPGAQNRHGNGCSGFNAHGDFVNSNFDHLNRVFNETGAASILACHVAFLRRYIFCPEAVAELPAGISGFQPLASRMLAAPVSCRPWASTANTVFDRSRAFGREWRRQ